MSGADLAVAAVAVACFYSLWWCLSLARRLRRIERPSKLDSLTGLGSGDWLQTERWPAALRSGRPLGVVYLDLDHLKFTNDALGHAAGDQYICTAADALRQAVRRGVDEVFRSYQAGDEFIVLLHGPLGDLRRCAESLLQRLSERGVSASLGLAYTTVTEFVPARAELRAAAEAACRQAKKRGGGCAVLAGHGRGTSVPNDSGVRGNGCPWTSTASTARHDAEPDAPQRGGWHARAQNAHEAHEEAPAEDQPGMGLRQQHRPGAAPQAHEQGGQVPVLRSPCRATDGAARPRVSLPQRGSDAAGRAAGADLPALQASAALLRVDARAGRGAGGDLSRRAGSARRGGDQS